MTDPIRAMTEDKYPLADENDPAITITMAWLGADKHSARRVLADIDGARASVPGRRPSEAQVERAIKAVFDEEWLSSPSNAAAVVEWHKRMSRALAAASIPPDPRPPLTAATIARADETWFSNIRAGVAPLIAMARVLREAGHSHETPAPVASDQNSETNAHGQDTGEAESTPVSVIDEIAAERKRQIEVEGWDADHDAEHDCGQLAKAAACYALHAGSNDDDRQVNSGFSPPNWPWTGFWKPSRPRRELIKAAALIVAEIERLDRGKETFTSTPVDGVQTQVRYSPAPIPPLAPEPAWTKEMASLIEELWAIHQCKGHNDAERKRRADKKAAAFPPASAWPPSDCKMNASSIGNGPCAATRKCTQGDCAHWGEGGERG